MNVKDKIKEIMSARGMTQYALAQETDISQASINNWYGKRNCEPKIESLEKICAVFGITLAQLFCEDESLIVVADDDLRYIFENWAKLNERQKSAILFLIDSYLKV